MSEIHAQEDIPFRSAQHIPHAWPWSLNIPDSSYTRIPVIIHCSTRYHERDLYLVCTDYMIVRDDETSVTACIYPEHIPIHLQLLFISSLYGPGLRQTLHYRHRAVELGIDELSGGHCSRSRDSPEKICSLRYCTRQIKPQWDGRSGQRRSGGPKLKQIEMY